MSKDNRNLSPAVQDYLKLIYRLQGEQEPATITSIAQGLQVSPASATGMVKKLVSLKLARHSPYRGVRLSAAGEKVALEVIRHHRLVELFLHESLGLPWDRVHEEAEKIEHVISEELEDRIAMRLGDPAVDPHGDPIPTRAGVIERHSGPALADLAPGQEGVIDRVGAQAPEHLRYLGGLGLVPNARVQVVEAVPFGGPVRVRVGLNEHVVDRSFARQIWLRSAPRPARPAAGSPKEKEGA